jgi:hypothetical protein
MEGTNGQDPLTKAVDDAKPYEQRGGRGGNCKPPTARNGPVCPLVFGWLALCGISLVVCHMTSW